MPTAPRLVSVIKAVENALTAWLRSQMPSVKFSTEWPQAGVPFAPEGTITLLRVGPPDEDPTQIELLKVVPTTGVNALFTFRTHHCRQDLALDVWTTSEPKRDDLIERVGEALSASKRETLAAFLEAQGTTLNQAPVEQAIALQLAAPWDHLIAAYEFTQPETMDDPDAVKRCEFRASYRGHAYFDRTRTRELPQLLNAKLRIVATDNGQAAPGAKYPTLTVTPSGTTVKPT